MLVGSDLFEGMWEALPDQNIPVQSENENIDTHLANAKKMFLLFSCRS